jgi:hypothetical protein
MVFILSLLFAITHKIKKKLDQITKLNMKFCWILLWFAFNLM